MKNKIHRSFFIAVLAITFLSSCYEPNEACLDRFASNYDVTTDDACTSCCTYPDLILQFSHNWDGTIVTAGDPLKDEFGNTFVLEQLEYFVSNVVVLDSDANETRILDTIGLDLESGSAVFVNDFQHISLSQTSYTIGELITDRDILSIRFTVGIEPSSIIFDESDEGFVLYEFKDSLYVDERFISWQSSIVRDTTDTILTDISGLPGELTEIELVKTISVNIGEAIVIPINVNLDLLFNGVNVKSTSDAELLSKMTNNISSAFK